MKMKTKTKNQTHIKTQPTQEKTHQPNNRTTKTKVAEHPKQEHRTRLHPYDTHQQPDARLN